MNTLNTFQGKIAAQKQEFEYKKRTENGMILEIHHTVVGEKGEVRRIKFFSVAFDHNEEQIAACDRKGNIFIIDLKASQLWTLPIMGKVSALAYASHMRPLILTASKDGVIHVRNVDNGSVVDVMEGHKEKVNGFSFDAEYFCLSASRSEAFIWDLQTYGIVHKLDLRSTANIIQAMFLPHSNDIAALFSDDSLHVWGHDTFEPKKKITSFQSKLSNANSLATSRDGKTLIIGGSEDIIVVYDAQTWAPLKQISLQNKTDIVNIGFIPQTFDLGSNKILAVLTKDYSLYVINIDSSMRLQRVETKDAVNFLCSENGKYMCCVSKSGEVHVYNVKQLFGKRKGELVSLPNDNSLKFVRSCENLKRIENQSKRSEELAGAAVRKAMRLREIQSELKKTLSLKKLRPILLQYHQYPDKHRNLIWRYLLKLPNNLMTYKSLTDRGLHKSFRNLDQTYPMKSIRSMRNLKTVLSVLAHWCPLFSQVDYLPAFVYPFVKVLENNSLMIFEAVYTVLVNYCQFWFEYHPVAPINILLIVENVLSEHCEVLIRHYNDLDVTSQEYAWPVLSTGFSEILDANQWCMLWDNILTNDTSFLLLAVVAYNVTQQNTIIQHQTKQDIKEFFRNKNHVDMNRFMKCIYNLEKNTSDDNHPRCFLKNFVGLPKDTYTVFTGYPKEVVDFQMDNLDRIEQEEEAILQQEMEALEKIQAQQDRIRDGITKEEHAKRLEALELKCKRLIEDQEKRLSERRFGVLDIQKDLETSERILHTDARCRSKDDASNRRAFEMWKVEQTTENKKANKVSEKLSAEDLHARYNRLLDRQLELESRMERNPRNDIRKVLKNKSYHENHLSNINRNRAVSFSTIETHRSYDRYS